MENIFAPNQITPIAINIQSCMGNLGSKQTLPIKANKSDECVIILGGPMPINYGKCTFTNTRRRFRRQNCEKCIFCYIFFAIPTLENPIKTSRLEIKFNSIPIQSRVRMGLLPSLIVIPNFRPLC
ncbi:hypothetical protein Zmor_023964 [Zophobas morio]|uniref:Uncharacterized protein n=1 Tax=Zophobas morio TaxID=2755281 RepID=A0AA38M7Z3_9CUCU|nr:hypothetical protein Zmor_023964 [Zophobas morio]